MVRYNLNIDCPVKWTATQEKSISNELPFTEISAPHASERVSHIYHQVLWLPESIMPLDRLVPALMCAVSVALPNTGYHQFEGHELLGLLKPHLMTPRQVTEKYHKRLAALMDQEESSDVDPDDELMWYIMRYDKGVPEDGTTPDAQAAYEAWKSAWLNRMEQREIMVQILLHFLLLTLPGIPEDESKPYIPNISTPNPSPRKRKHVSSSSQDSLSAAALEECLEVLMDKLAMWQLIYSVDLNAGGDGGVRQTHRLTSFHKNKPKNTDDRDWMQIFCEDVVEPAFRSKLPTQCSLLRSKVFQTSPFDDEDSFDLPDSPPASPKLDSQRPKKSASRANEGSREKKDLSRTRSLSITLEEERVRARSRSLSIGPNAVHKRALAREVSMTTAFKGKEKKKAQDPSSRRNALGRTKSTADAVVVKAKGKDRVGTTLVAATPRKVKPKGGRSFSSAFPDGKDVLPTLIDESGLNNTSRRAVEGGDDDDDWTLRSSPDILLLTDDERNTSPSADGLDDDAKERLFFGRSRTLVEGTPTRRRR
ncbi:hypothetical protein BDY19DRAFT_895413 [Irpex rosettiformis]|uniref:Uncharacterized protein n=1 Tax=Irpex rosettiformis TaxID=378272 RepID=A0ACB8TVJ4_9APHY|nr:hypothetical protein BDY19DRAFT_895413 [Irpex rosettiformis]